MNETQLIDALLRLLKAEERVRAEFQEAAHALVGKLEAEREARLSAALERWKRTGGFLSRDEYLGKYALEKDLLAAAVEQGLVEEVSSPHPDQRSLHFYRDQPVPERPLAKLRATLDEETFLVTRKASAFLGASPQKLAALKRAGRIEASVPPWNADGLYPGTYYRLSDLRTLKGQLGQPALSAAQRQRWADLNDRQRRYLTLLHEVEAKREAYYRSQAAMSDPRRKGGEWRWIRHHSTPTYEGFDRILERAQLLDQGTGATFQALEGRGYLIRRWLAPALNEALHEVEPLEIKLTRSGRKLVKDMARLA